MIDEKQGDISGAVEQYSRAIAVQPTDVELLLLAHALEQEGRADEAKAAFERAASMSPNLPAAQKRAESLRGGK
ncbi:MAG: tetratricopeptide repeat protein [Terriglobales bacterium]